MFRRSWEDDRRSYENFNQRTGEGGDSPDAEPFYTWGTLLPMIAEADLLDLDPIDGLCVGSPSLRPSRRRRCRPGRGDRLHAHVSTAAL